MPLLHLWLATVFSLVLLGHFSRTHVPLLAEIPVIPLWGELLSALETGGAVSGRHGFLAHFSQVNIYNFLNLEFLCLINANYVFSEISFKTKFCESQAYSIAFS